ncbi:MAG: cell division protein ZapA [Bacteroidetes bacterium]|nr:cell division protein ZapA [Rhodothermia bacterium]MCS7154652.1 cell division protein ZapA [Bacteroidota bacterium]MCX7906369.1 cell division protein ZapA [Bacteroidota bacterium]MDW8285601.1 cell division protein ZapA [Bacteroidota bacterium]
MDRVPIRILILDQEYTFRVPADQETALRQAAAEVDRRMQEYREQRPGLPDTLYAVMTALYLALELQARRHRQEVAMEEWRTALRQLTDWVQRITGDAPPVGPAGASRERRQRPEAGS